MLGAWVSFGTLPFACDRITVIFDSTTSGTVYSALMNIGIGASGSQVNLVSNIPFMDPGAVNGYQEFSLTLNTPLLPAGTDIWVNIQSSIASFAPRISIGVDFVGHGSRTPVTTLGAVLSSSNGTPYSTGSGAYGSWVSLGNLAIPARKMIVLSTRDLNSLNTVNIGVGTSGSQVIVAQNVPVVLFSLPVVLEGYFPPGNYWIAGQGADVSTNYAEIMLF